MGNAEDKFNEIVAKFKEAVKGAADESIDQIHSELVPYLNDDTENNARNRADEIVRKIIEGNYDVREGWVVVDGWPVYRFTLFTREEVLCSLSEKCSNEASKAYIESLENKVKDLERQIYGQF